MAGHGHGRRYVRCPTPSSGRQFSRLASLPRGRSRRATSFVIYDNGGTAHDWADNVEMALPLVPLTVPGGKGSLLRPVEPEVEAEGRERRLVEIGLGRDAEAREVGEGGFSLQRERERDSRGTRGAQRKCQEPLLIPSRPWSDAAPRRCLVACCTLLLHAARTSSERPLGTGGTRTAP
jgi:hypothetical protein